MQIRDAGFSIRTTVALLKAGITDTVELWEATDKDLYKIRNIGDKSVQEIRNWLDEAADVLDDKLDITTIHDEEIAHAWTHLLNSITGVDGYDIHVNITDSSVVIKSRLRNQTE